jgi:hypothetical protein
MSFQQQKNRAARDERLGLNSSKDCRMDPFTACDQLVLESTFSSRGAVQHNAIEDLE